MTGSVTGRGRVWLATLCHLSQADSFERREVEGIDDVDASTIVRTWREMEELGVLERKHAGAQRWYGTDAADVLVKSSYGLEFDANAGDGR